MTPPPFTLPLIAFMVTLGVIRYLIKGNILKVLDHPNPRSLHSRAVPRTGGLGLMSGILVSWMFLPDTFRTAVNVEGDMVGSLVVQKWVRSE